MDGDKLDVRLVIGGLWKGAVVTMEGGAHGTVRGAVAVHRSADTTRPAWLFGYQSWNGYEPVPDGGSGYWTVSLMLPGPRGLGLAGLLWGVKERAGIDSRGRCPAPPCGATWIAAETIAKACASGSERRIVWASKRLAMTDALAAKECWPTGPGAPVWAWTRSDIATGVWWKLSARASATESWIHEYSCEIEDPDAALEAVWARECAR